MTGVFCEIYGNGIRNRVIQFFLENQFGDFAISSLTMQLKISRPKAYEYVGKFEASGYVLKSRVIGKTQLYKLNKSHKHVKILMKTFMSCLDLVAEEYSQKKNHTGSSSSVGAISVKNV